MSTFSTLASDARARWLGTGALATLLVVAAATPAFVGSNARAVDPTTTPPEHTISVSSVGRVTVTPDVADVRIGVMLTRPTATGARDAAAAAMAKVVAALKAAGVADRDIQTGYLSLQPVYDYSKNGAAPTLTGYQMSNSVTATVRDIATVAQVVDSAVGAGATTIDGITFRVDDPTKAEDLARTKAMTDARRRADALAAAAGVSIAGVAQVSESQASTPPVYFPSAGGAKDAMAAAVPTPVQPGTTDVTLSVSVTYLIR
jgi:uncharacterized protein YggE